MSWNHAETLPPLGGLRAFDVSARLGSFTAAAQALGVTQGAVSRQVMALERSLGLPLFERHHRRIELTEAGRRLAAATAEAFGRLAEVAAELSRQEGELRLVVSATLCVRWLMPRLHGFLAAHPRLALSLRTGLTARGEGQRDYEGVIGYARDGRLPAGAELLLPDRCGLVCTPAYLERSPPLRGPADIARHRILLNTGDPWDWRAWAAQCGAPALPLRRAFGFDTDEMALQAALAGSGIGLVTLALVEGELAQGRLLRPARLPTLVLGAYYLLAPRIDPEARRFAPVRDWLLAEAAASAQAIERAAAESVPATV